MRVRSSDLKLRRAWPLKDPEIGAMHTSGAWVLEINHPDVGVALLAHQRSGQWRLLPFQLLLNEKRTHTQYNQLWQWIGAARLGRVEFLTRKALVITVKDALDRHPLVLSLDTP